MGQAIKIGGIDDNNMIGVWALQNSENAHGTTVGTVVFSNPFDSRDITVEYNITTTAHTMVPITGMAVSGSDNHIILYFDPLETGVNIAWARCKVYMNRN